MSHVFISYSHADRDYVGQLAKHLQANQFTVWYDANLQVGQNWQDELAIAINTSSAIIIVMSETGTDFEWIKKEITLATKLGIPIIPLLLSGKPFDKLSSIQYFSVKDGSMPSSDFFKVLRKNVRPNSSYFIEKLIQALEDDKGFVEQGISDQQSQLDPAYIGIRKQSLILDINAICLIRADHLSPSQMKTVHDDFYAYLTRWKPSFFMERLIKKRGVLCFVFEEHTSQENVEFIKQLARNSEENKLELIDGVLTVSWALSLDLERLEGQSMILSIFPPVIADHYPGKKWLQDFIPKRMKEYAQSKKVFALTI